MATPAALAASARPAVGNRIGRVPATQLVPRADVPNALVFAPSLNQAVGNLSDTVVGLIDSIRKMLSTLPANPVSEFLSGALYLVRRTLRPVGADVGLFGRVACVATKNCSDKDLAGADLSGRTLTALDFSGAVLNGVDFSGADLSQADLSGSRLHKANLTDVNLRDANLLGADLVGADLDGVTNFGTATLTGADLSGQILIRLDLSDKDLTGTDFGGAILSGTDLSGANLSDADFESAGLAGVNLSNADLTGSNLADADLSDVTWGDTPCPGGVDCAPGGDTAAADTGGGAVDAVLTGSVDPGPVGSDPSIATNPNFSYADAILAGQFSALAYQHREGDFKELVEATGWQGISVLKSRMGPGGSSPAGGGYKVIGTQDGMGVQSYAFAGQRVAADGTTQFIFAVEGSNECSTDCLLGFPRAWEEPQDWDANVRQYGWSRYYASLQPLMAEVLRQMIDVQKSGKKAQLIITGHSLGGATAMIAYADLMDSTAGDLYPGSRTTVLAFNKRIWDKVGVWDEATLKAIQDVTTVYTFGAPSPLIDPVKEPGGLPALIQRIRSLDVLGLYKAISTFDKVQDALLPAPFRDQTVNRIFQFEHKGDGRIEWKTVRDEATGTSIYVPVFRKYADDIVATLGNRDPGYVFDIKLRDDVQRGYVGGDAAAQQEAAATHPIGLYNESLIRLVTWDALLANSAPVESVVGARTSRGNGIDGRNDVFREMIPNCSTKEMCEFIGYSPRPGDSRNNAGKGGNDWYAPALGTSYLVNGGPGSDLYALYKSSIEQVTIDGRSQSGTDVVVFYGGLEGSDIEVKWNQRSGGVAVSYRSKANNSYTTLLIQNWDRWQPSDVFYTKNVDDRLTLARLPKPKIGPSS
jgi:hypothetical protein